MAFSYYETFSKKYGIIIDMTLEDWKSKLSAFEFNEVLDRANYEWEEFQEEYIEEHKRKPTKKMKEKFKERYFKEHALPHEPIMGQAEKEKKQLHCLLWFFVKRKERLSVGDMEATLIANDLAKGSSVKTIYRRILPELKKYGIIKGNDDLYYYDSASDESEEAKKARIFTFLSKIIEFHKDSPVYIEAKNFLFDQLKKILYDE